MYTTLVFSLNITYIYHILNFKPMSDELLEFSDLIDEQIDLSFIKPQNIWDYILSLFR